MSSDRYSLYWSVSGRTNPVTRGDRIGTQQCSGWDTELDCVPVGALTLISYISFVINRVTAGMGAE